MIETITLINVTKQKNITLSKSSLQFVLDSINWDAPSIESSVYRVPYQIGSTLDNIVIGTRKPTIEGYVIADTSAIDSSGMSWDEYYKRQLDEINNSKEFLDDVIAVYDEVIIVANGYYLKGYPTQPVKYSSEEQENNEVLCKFSAEFECFEPLFYRDSRIVHLAYTISMFHFPWIMTEDKTDEYTVFGEIHKRSSLLVENEGNVDVGCTITVKAVGGSVSNPRVYNVNTSEFIEFNGLILNDGETLVIVTETGKENAVKHSIARTSDESVIGLMTIGSEFLKIRRGANYYAYSADEQSMNNIDVTIEYTEKFFNVRGM